MKLAILYCPFVQSFESDKWENDVLSDRRASIQDLSNW